MQNILFFLKKQKHKNNIGSNVLYNEISMLETSTITDIYKSKIEHGLSSRICSSLFIKLTTHITICLLSEALT